MKPRHAKNRDAQSCDHHGLHCDLEQGAWNGAKIKRDRWSPNSAKLAAEQANAPMAKVSDCRIAGVNTSRRASYCLNPKKRQCTREDRERRTKETAQFYVSYRHGT
jgi:hypothetical protein